jgi:hypothetical protein
MRLMFGAIAMLAVSACVSPSRNGPRKDKPLVVRVSPNGYELVEEDGLANRRECIPRMTSSCRATAATR